jgi:hypothetical protein
MTDGTPGWFRDPNDDTLARWHDGKNWTEHTLVIADQAPGVEPEPPVIAEPEPEPEPAAFAVPRRDVPTGREVPGWAKVLGPVAVLALVVVAFVVVAGGDDDTPDDEATTSETLESSLDDAVRAARRAGLDDAVSDARAAALIERICAATSRPASVEALGEDLADLPADDPSDLRQQVGALGVGAATRCPDDLEDNPDLVDDLQDLAVVAAATTTTVPDVGVDGGTDAGVTDSGDGTDEGSDGTGTGSSSGRRTTTTRRSGGASVTTATTAAPTTTLQGVLRNSSCSREGATARDKVTGGTLTCQKSCSVGTRLTWRSGTCPTNTAPPTTTPGQTIPPDPDQDL